MSKDFLKELHSRMQCKRATAEENEERKQAEEHHEERKQAVVFNDVDDDSSSIPHNTRFKCELCGVWSAREINNQLPLAH